MSSSPGRRSAFVAAAATALACLLVVAHLGVLVFPAAVLLLALALPPGLGLTSRLLASLALVFAANTAMAFVTLQPLVFAMVWVLPAAVVVGYRGLRASVGDVRLEDGLTAAVAAVASAVLLLPWATREVSGQLAYMQPGEDNASHMGIVSGIRSFGGLLYQTTDLEVPGVIPGLRTYPQGAHVNVAVVANLVQGRTGVSDIASAVQAYSFAMLLALTLLVVALSVLSLRLAQAAGAPRAGWCVAVAVPPAVVIGGPASSLLSFGFFTQVVAYAALAVLCAVAADPRWDWHPWWRLVVIGCCVVAVASSFYFLLPVLAVTCLAVLWSAREELKAHPLRGLALAALTVGLSLPHVLASLDGGATSAVNANGGVRFLDSPVLVLTVVGALLFLARAFAARAGRHVSPWAWSLVAATVFTLAFRKYQLSTAGATSYYFFKSLYTVQLLAVVALGAAGALAMGSSTARRRFLSLATGVTTATGFVAFLVVQSGHEDNELHKSLYAAQYDNGFDAALAVLSAPDLQPVVFWKYGDALSDYNRNRQLGAAFLQDDASRAAAVASGFREQQPASLVGLVRAGRGLVILTHDGDLQSQLTAAGVTPADLATIQIRVVP